VLRVASRDRLAIFLDWIGVLGNVGCQGIKQDLTIRSSDLECEWVLLVVKFELSRIWLLTQWSGELFLGNLILFVPSISNMNMKPYNPQFRSNVPLKDSRYSV
jgi:hypothetical protein